MLSGDDGFTLAVMAHGGDGVVSVISNVVPRMVAALCSAMQRGDLAGARLLERRMAPIIHAAFVESNPIPIKAMLHLQRRMQSLCLPLVLLSDVHGDTVRHALATADSL